MTFSTVGRAPTCMFSSSASIMPPREAPPVGSDVAGPPVDSSLSFTEDLTAEASPVIASAVKKFHVITHKKRSGIFW